MTLPAKYQLNRKTGKSASLWLHLHLKGKVEWTWDDSEGSSFLLAGHKASLAFSFPGEPAQVHLSAPSVASDQWAAF